MIFVYFLIMLCVVFAIAYVYQKFQVLSWKKKADHYMTLWAEEVEAQHIYFSLQNEIENRKKNG